MKKLISLFVVLALVGGAFFSAGEVHADSQIDEGQSKSQSPIKFFVGRYARTGAVGTAGANVISKDSLVVWDSTSNDGVTIVTSTTSNDGLVAGITMDLIPGSSRDNTASEDEGYNNWGRIQCWGRYDEARWAAHMFQNNGSAPAGSRVATSATAQAAGLYSEALPGSVATGTSHLNTSKDSVGVLLEATTAADTAIDIFVDRC